MQFSGITITGGFNVAPLSAPVVPTDPYWANVSFLSETTSTNGQTNNTFLDSSTNNATITRFGSTTQGSYTPFTVANGTSYSTATNGGSGYFNGTTDYLSAPNSAAFDFGTGDFTIEGWFYLTGDSAVNPGGRRDATIIGCWSDSNTNNVWNIFLIGNGSTTGTGIVLDSFSGGTESFLVATTTITKNVWTHFAVVKQSSNVVIYINGASVGTKAYSAAVNSGGNALRVASLQQTGGGYYNYFPGYLSSTRIVKGTAVYTANFTPSTTPLTAISGTSILMNFTNAGMYDATTISNLTGFGTAQASTTQAKWSPTSAYFNGSASYLYAQPNTAFAFGTGDFTVECWVNFASLSPGGSGAIVPFCQSDAIGSSTNNKWWFGYTASTLRFATHNAGGFSCTIPFSPSTGTWYYVTVVRSSGTIYMFVGGTSGTVTTTGTPSGYSLSQNGLSVGGFSTPAYLNGYIQDLRVTKGVARYTTTFTPPTAALPTSA